jgi:hypothetical protein
MQLMFGLAAQLKTLTAKSLAAALCLSISGAFCLFCCQSMSAQTAPDSCPLAKTSHCNSSKNKAAKSGAPAAKGVDAYECCALKFNFFVAKLEKNKRQQQSADAAVAPPNALVLSRLKTYAARRELPARIYRPPDFDGRGQRLKNCLLRI